MSLIGEHEMTRKSKRLHWDIKDSFPLQNLLAILLLEIFYIFTFEVYQKYVAANI